jgi:hypothetical protein
VRAISSALAGCRTGEVVTAEDIKENYTVDQAQRELASRSVGLFDESFLSAN